MSNTIAFGKIGTAWAAAAALAGLLLPSAGPLSAQSPIDFTVSGNSTVRSWSCTVRGTARITTGAGEAVAGFDRGVQSATLTVPVAQFDCPEDEMEQHLSEAMHPDQYPEITFRLESYQPSGQGAVATGTLTILNSTQQVRFPIFLTPSGSGVQVTGTLPLDMTTYGVQPPVVLGGLLRVRPQIRIEFTGVVNP